MIDVKTKERELIWQKKPYQPDADKMYGFTPAMVNANYMTSKLEKVLPPTDSRRRPD